MRIDPRKGWLMAATALCLAAAGGSGAVAAEKTLISGDNITAVAEDSWCSPEISVTIVSDTPDTHYTGNFLEVQKLLGGLRAVLPFECPGVTRIGFTATGSDRVPLLEGAISEDGGWRLTEIWEVEPPVQVAEAEEPENDFIIEDVVLKKRDDGEGENVPEGESQTAEIVAPGLSDSLAAAAKAALPQRVEEAADGAGGAEEADTPVIALSDGSTDETQAARPEEASEGEAQPADVAEAETAAEATTASDAAGDTDQAEEAVDPVPEEETYAEGLQRLWRESAFDFSEESRGDLTGRWRSPASCGTGENRNYTPYFTATVYRQQGDAFDVLVRGERVVARVEENDPKRNRNIDFAARFEGTREGDSYMLRLRQDLSKWNETSGTAVGSENVANLRVNLLEEEPSDFTPDKNRCMTTLVRESDDVSLAETHFQLWRFAHYVLEYSEENPVNNGVIGVSPGRGFSVPGCQVLLDHVQRYPLTDRLVVGGYELYRHFNDENYIRTFGLPVTALTQQQRQAILERGRECARQSNHYRQISEMFGYGNPWSLLDDLMKAERELSVLHAQQIFAASSEPEFALLVLDQDLGKELHKGSLNAGLNLSSYTFRGLSSDHWEQYRERVRVVREIIAPVAAETIGLDYGDSEKEQQDYLWALNLMRDAYPGDRMDALVARTERRITSFSDERLQQRIAELEALPDVKSSFHAISATLRDASDDLEGASAETAERFRQTVEDKRNAVAAGVRDAADRELDSLRELVRDLPDRMGSFADLARFGETATRWLGDASPEQAEAFNEAVEKRREELLDAIAGTALDEIGAEEATMSGIPFDIEGWEQAREGEQRILGHISTYREQWREMLADESLRSEYDERFDGLLEANRAVQQEILLSIREDMVEEAQSRGLAGFDDILDNIRELRRVTEDHDWASKSEGAVRSALRRWVSDNPDAAREQMLADDEVIRVAADLYAPIEAKDIPETVLEVISDRYAEDVYDIVMEAHGVDMRQKPDRSEAMVAPLAKAWIALVRETAEPLETSPAASFAIRHVVEKETEALATLAREHADGIHWFVEETLALGDEEFTQTDLHSMVLVMLRPGHQETVMLMQESPSARVKAVMQEAVSIDYSLRWPPETESALDEARERHAVALLERAIEMYRSLRSGERANDIARYFEDKPLMQALLQVEDFLSNQFWVPDDIGNSRAAGLLREFVDEVRRDAVSAICRAATEEAGLGERDARRLVLSSAGRAESLESLACRMSASGSKVLQYKAAGTFGDEHELMFETLEGDVLTAVLVEAEVRPGQKLLVGKALKDPLSQWDITASEWRQQVEELVEPMEAAQFPGWAFDF